MALLGETVGEVNTRCVCGETLEIKVLRSAAGYYIGFFCDKCGPYSRESGYYPNRETAERMLHLSYFGR